MKEEPTLFQSLFHKDNLRRRIKNGCERISCKAKLLKFGATPHRRIASILPARGIPGLRLSESNDLESVENV